MTVLVAGGAGFIGSHLCDALLKAGHRVVCVDDLSRGTEANIQKARKNEAFVFCQMDVNDNAGMARLFVREKPDYVMHLAANSDIQASALAPEVEYRNTLTTTYSLLEQMRLHGVKRIFFASTSAVYGQMPGLLNEAATPLVPVSYYGAAKLAGEAMVNAYSYMNDMAALVLRFPNVIGPRLTHGVVYDFIHKLRENPEELEILGDGNQTKPYLYVDDLVDAIVRFMDVPQGVALYNAGVDSATSVRRIADIVCEEMGLQNVRYHFNGGEGGWKGDVPRFQYDLGKIHATGWKARYSSDEAVRQAIGANISKNGE